MGGEAHHRVAWLVLALAGLGLGLLLALAGCGLPGGVVLNGVGKAVAVPTAGAVNSLPKRTYTEDDYVL